MTILGEYIKVQGGYAYKSKDFIEFSKNKVLKIKNVRFGTVDYAEPAYVSDEIAASTKNWKVKEGDVLISMTGSGPNAPQSLVGRVARVWKNEPDAWINQRVGRVCLLDENSVHLDFIFYWLSLPQSQDYLVSNSSGSANQANISGKIIESLPCPKVDYQTSKQIADLARNFDEKVILNFQTNQTLEQMAQAIFKSWFVDFDPVKAKMNGEQPEGMDAATASLFPEKLVESELGLIPEGWEVGTLDSHTSMIIDHRGKTPKKLGSDWVEEGYPAISAKNIKSKKIVRPDTIRFIDEVTYKKWMKEPLIKGDIIMTSEAPMGELYFFDGSQDFCLSQRLYGLRANSDVCSPEFLFNWLQTTKAKSDMEGRASGTTALGIKQAELRKVKILTPPRELLEKYSVVASNLVGMAAKNNAQNTVLEDLRDTLLPKLLSGEIELEASKPLVEPLPWLLDLDTREQVVEAV